MMDLNNSVLIGAYGRQYHDARAVEKAFIEGYDFMLNTPLGTTYCSIRDFKPGDRVELRYGTNNENVTLMTVRQFMKEVSK